MAQMQKKNKQNSWILYETSCETNHAFNKESDFNIYMYLQSASEGTCTCMAQIKKTAFCMRLGVQQIRANT